MKVIAWNLTHQVKKKPIPDYLVDVITDLEADTVLFNEYVDGDFREPFKEAMREAGFSYQAVTTTARKLLFEVAFAPPFGLPSGSLSSLHSGSTLMFDCWR